MSGLIGDMNFNYANLFSQIPGRVAETALTEAKVPYTQAQTTKTGVETEMERIRVRAGQKQMEMLEGTGTGQNNYITDPAALGVTQSTMQPSTPASTTLSATTAAPTSNPMAPGSGSGFGAPAPQPTAAPAAPAPGTPDSAPGGVAMAGDLAQRPITQRYPGSYQLADVSGTTPPPTQVAQTAPAPAPVTATPLPAPAAAAPAAPAAPPAAPAPSTGLVAQGPASGQLQRAGQAPDISPNGVVIPGVGPVSRVMAATMYGAIANGQDMGTAMKQAQEMRYRRLAELASNWNNTGDWQRNILTAYNEGLIDKATAQTEYNIGPQGRLQWVRSLTTAAEQLSADVTLAQSGGAITPRGIGPDTGALEMTRRSALAGATGRGDLREITEDDPNNPGTQRTRYLTPSDVQPGMPRGPAEPAAPVSYDLKGVNHDNLWTAITGFEGGPDGSIQPGTFAQQGGKNYNDPAERQQVAQAYYEKLWAKYNGDPGRIATAWISGEGNVAPAGSGSPYVSAGPTDKNGYNAPRYLRAVLGRIPGVVSSSGAPYGTPPVAQTPGVQGGGFGMGRPPTGNTVAIGDSHIGGLRTAGVPGSFVNGANPQAVLAQIRAAPRSSIEGKDVVLSGGFSNDGGHQNTGLVADQVAALKEKGAKSVTVLGVGPGAGGDAVNRQLALMSGTSGARFVPLEGQFQPGGVHLQDYGPLARSVRTSEAAPAEGQRYQTTSLAFVPPPAQPSQAQPAEFAGRTVWSPEQTAASERDRPLIEGDSKTVGELGSDQLALDQSIASMHDVLTRVDQSIAGPGADWRRKLSATLGQFGPGWVQDFAKKLSDGNIDPGQASNSEVVMKQLFMSAAQAEGQLTRHGGLGLTQLYSSMFPNPNMMPQSIKEMTSFLTMMQLRTRDWNQGATSHFNQNYDIRPGATDPNTGAPMRYQPISKFTENFNATGSVTAPRVYGAGVAIMDGKSPAVWGQGLSEDQKWAAIQAAKRVGYKFDPAQIPKRFGGTAED